MKEFYVERPELKPYEGIKVQKDTELTFENEKVKQELKDLKLKTTYVYETTKYKTTNVMEMNLEEGEILLLEEEDRGYFLPLNTPIGTIETAIKDYEALISALKGDDNNDINRDKNADTSIDRRTE